MSDTSAVRLSAEREAVAVGVPEPHETLTCMDVDRDGVCVPCDAVSDGELVEVGFAGDVEDDCVGERRVALADRSCADALRDALRLRVVVAAPAVMLPDVESDKAPERDSIEIDALAAERVLSTEGEYVMDFEAVPEGCGFVDETVGGDADSVSE